MHADPAKAQAWHQNLASEPRFRIGIVWSADPVHFASWRMRTTTPQAFSPITQIPDVELHSLQMGQPAQWPWMSDSHRTVWYDSMELDRQETFDEWAGLLQHAAADVAKLPATKALRGD